MLDHFVCSVVAIPLLIAAGVRLFTDRLPPSTAAHIVAWSSAAAAVASTITLVLFTVTAFAAIPAVGRALGLSSDRVDAGSAPETGVPWLCAAMLGGAIVTLVRTWRRGRADLSLDAPPPDGLIVVPDPVPAAFAVAARTPYVMVSTGMIELLSDRQLDALLAHERAHLSGGHHRLVRVTELAAAAHPVLRSVVGHVDYLVERAADEHAATEVGNRRTVAHAIGTAALGASQAAGPGAGLHAVSDGGIVPRRVAQLLRPRIDRRWWPALVLTALATGSLVWTTEAMMDLYVLLRSSLLH